jgi:DNA gyrase/topoisomerase IV subunit B
MNQKFDAMSNSNTSPQLDLAATAVRAFMLYSLAEFQSGSATTIRVTAEGPTFSISDDGRGHPIDKMLEGTSYLRFIYTHFDYPFETSRSAPIQLQGIGMSLVNAICSELTLTVRKREETLTVSFQDGQVRGSNRIAAENNETGITVAARLRPELPLGGAQTPELEEWLQGIAQTHPALKLFFNHRELKARPQGAA